MGDEDGEHPFVMLSAAKHLAAHLRSFALLRMTLDELRMTLDELRMTLDGRLPLLADELMEQ